MTRHRLLDATAGLLAGIIFQFCLVAIALKARPRGAGPGDASPAPSATRAATSDPWKDIAPASCVCTSQWSDPNVCGCLYTDGGLAPMPPQTLRMNYDPIRTGKHSQPYSLRWFSDDAGSTVIPLTEPKR